MYGMRTLGHALSEWYLHQRATRLLRIIGTKISTRHRVMLLEEVLQALHYGVREIKLRRGLL